MRKTDRQREREYIGQTNICLHVCCGCYEFNSLSLGMPTILPRRHENALPPFTLSALTSMREEDVVRLDVSVQYWLRGLTVEILDRQH